MPNNPPKIYVESCCFIDLAKTRYGTALKEADREKQIWFAERILRAGRAGDLQVYTSAMTSIECIHINRQYSPEIQQIFKGLLSGASGVIIVQPDPFIIDRARELRWVYNIELKPMDSLHVASALEVGCVELITTDNLILNRLKATEIKAKNLRLRATLAADTAYLDEKYRQGSLEAAPQAVVPEKPPPRGRRIKI
jgi:hypothetical protein